MRKVNSKIEEWKLEEAFRAGKSKEMIPKILRIITRKTGIDFYNKDAEMIFPEEYQNATGKYLGFMVFTKIGGEAFRFNFALEGDSERIVSVDYFNEPSSFPRDTIEIPKQFNIVQVMDHIVAVLSGEYAGIIDEAYRRDSKLIEKKVELKERESHKDIIRTWVEGDPNAQDALSRRGPDWDGLLNEYIDFLEETGYRISPPAKVTFQVNARKAFHDMGDDAVADNIPHVNVRRGQRETIINTDEQSEQVFDESIVQNEHLEKFNYMEWIFTRIQAGDKEFNGVYLFGQGGVGKSYAAEQMLKPLPNCTYFEGVIQGYTGLLELLYKNRKDKILVIDDSIDHKLMTNTTVQNILKLAMLPDPPNRIQISKRGGGESDSEEAEVMGASMDAPPSGSEDLVDFTSDEGILGADTKDSPEDFQFDSWLVFITNYPKVPQPIADRTERIEFIFSNDQVTDIIERALAACEPKNLSVDVKREALEWLRDKIRTVGSKATLSFRLFRQISYLYATAPSDKWEQWAFSKLQAG